MIEEDSGRLRVRMLPRKNLI